MFASGQSRSARDALYSLRSNLVHGRTTLSYDTTARLFDVTPLGQAEDIAFRKMASTTRIALLTWLQNADLRDNFRKMVNEDSGTN